MSGYTSLRGDFDESKNFAKDAYMKAKGKGFTNQDVARTIMGGLLVVFGALLFILAYAPSVDNATWESQQYTTTVNFKFGSETGSSDSETFRAVLITAPLTLYVGIYLVAISCIKPLRNNYHDACEGNGIMWMRWVFLMMPALSLVFANVAMMAGIQDSMHIASIALYALPFCALQIVNESLNIPNSGRKNYWALGLSGLIFSYLTFLFLFIAFEEEDPITFYLVNIFVTQSVLLLGLWVPQVVRASKDYRVSNSEDVGVQEYLPDTALFVIVVMNALAAMVY